MNLRHAVLVMGLWLPFVPTVWGQDPVDPAAAAQQPTPLPDLSPSSPDPQPSPADDLAIVEVFMLKYVEATDVSNMLTELLPDGRFVADERVNSVIVRANREQLEIVRTLLLALDSAPDRRQQRGTPRTDLPGEAQRPSDVEELLNDLRGKYASNEQQTQSIAAALAAERDAKATKRLREQLTIVVAEAFGLRQELQRAELALLRERIHRIESQVNQRETLRDAIIKHRVDQLVSGEAPAAETLQQIGNSTPSLKGIGLKGIGLKGIGLKGIGLKGIGLKGIGMHFDDAPWEQVLRWFADQNGVALQLNHQPAGTFSYHSPRQHTLEEARAVIVAALPTEFELLQNEGQIILRRRPDLLAGGSMSVNGVTTMRRPDDYRRAFEDLHTTIAQYERLGSALKGEDRLDAAGLHILNTIPKLKKQLARLTSEYTAQVRLFELELGAEQVAVETTEKGLERVQALFENGQVSSAEIGQAKLAYEQARVRIDQTQTLLDLYRQAVAEAPPDPLAAPEDQPPADATSNGDASRNGVPIEAIPDEGIRSERR